MRRRDFLLTSAALGAGTLPVETRADVQASAPAPPSNALPLVRGGVYQAGTQAQLFIDQMVVQSTDNVAFTMHPARRHPGNPIMKAEEPWEGWRLEIFGNVIYDADERLFKMWYIGEAPEYFPCYAGLYATSPDGIHWQRQPVGTIASQTPCKHNAVADRCILPNVTKDYDDPDPARRYKMITYHWDHHYSTFVSPDGLNWTRYSEQPIAPGADVVTGYYDRQRKIWVALVKIYGTPPGLAHNRRMFWVTTSADFKTWTAPQLAFFPDAKDDAGSLGRIEAVRARLDVEDRPDIIRTEFYGIGFYQAESCTLGFPWMFTINNNARYGNEEGPGELQLAVTRDLVHWERPFRTPCVPRGTLGEWDGGFYSTANEALRVGDEIWLYYTGSNYTHGTPCLYRAEGTGRKTQFTGSIGLATWPLDRFVSVDGPAEGGSLTTVPLQFSGRRLELNVNALRTKQPGSVRVELLTPAGAPIDGLGMSDPIQVDSLRQTVTWNGQSDLSAWQGKPVSLKFHLQGAELYSFAFRE